MKYCCNEIVLNESNLPVFCPQGEKSYSVIKN